MKYVQQWNGIISRQWPSYSHTQVLVYCSASNLSYCILSLSKEDAKRKHKKLEQQAEKAAKRKKTAAARGRGRGLGGRARGGKTGK